jgi:hypothetical protein
MCGLKRLILQGDTKYLHGTVVGFTGVLYSFCLVKLCRHTVAFIMLSTVEGLEVIVQVKIRYFDTRIPKVLSITRLARLNR